MRVHVLLLHAPQADFDAQVGELRREAQGLREALEAQRTELERYYAGINTKVGPATVTGWGVCRRCPMRVIHYLLAAMAQRLLTW